MHCLSRTPSSQKSQLGNNYSAISMKLCALEPGRVSTLNRSHFHIIPSSQNISELNQIKGARHIDESRNFGCRADERLPPYVMDHPFDSVVQCAPSYDPLNFSCSQTTTTTLSRDNSMKSLNPKKGRAGSSKKAPNVQQHDNRINSFAQKLKKVLIFKNLAVEDGKEAVKKKVSAGSVVSGNTISNSSLKEIDEEEFNSSELAQMMHDIDHGMRSLPTQAS